MIYVGANVGMYTIWAAATRNARVYAFEPEAQNYATLNRNIALNNLIRIRARSSELCAAESEHFG
jgi:FkbM family methyltransferase